MRVFFLGLGIAAALSNVVLLILIMAALDRRGIKTNMFVARLNPYRYLSAYEKATRKETGKTGRLHGLWVFTIILAAVTAVVGILLPKA